jgi:hypothetical protein
MFVNFLWSDSHKFRETSDFELTNIELETHNLLTTFLVSV